MSVLVSVCSIAATAWLAVRTTARAIRQEQGQAFTDDTRIYDALLARAATRPDWRGVQALVDRLARQTGHRITLTGPDRRPIADSAAQPGPLPAKASATVDPLAVDPAFSAAASGPSGDAGIDPRAVGPFRLPTGERDTLALLAAHRAACLHDSLGLDASVTTGPSGRPAVVTAPTIAPPPDNACVSARLDRPTPTEARALTRLESLVNACLSRRDTEPILLSLDLSWKTTGSRDATAARLAQQCLTTARREQLAPYVASPALLFVGSPPQATSVFDLSQPNRLRIAGVVSSVLLLTVTVTVLAGRRLVRPLWALTGAAQRLKDGERSTRVEVTGNDEIGRLAEAFNAMSERRAELEEQRTAMVSDVAHELRTPLSNIRGWLEAAEDGVVPPDQALVSSLLEEALLLQHVVEDLRDLAAADAGELRLTRTPTDLPDLLAQVATAHGGRAEAAGVTLRVSAQADPARHVEADPLRLRQAVGNLVSNAVRHTPPGGTVTLSTRQEPGAVLIEVTDTGTGIAPEDLPHVFDRFWRAEKSRSRETGGSGLGLSIVRDLVRAHGGTATAASTPGEGSAFTLRLPDRPEPRPQGLPDRP